VKAAWGTLNVLAFQSLAFQNFVEAVGLCEQVARFSLLQSSDQTLPEGRLMIATQFVACKDDGFSAYDVALGIKRKTRD